MPADLKEIIEQLRLERSILKDGGYGRSPHTPRKAERIFRDSITCLNVGLEVKRHPCSECMLWEWVPDDHKDKDIPCHFIPLNAQGESIAALEEKGDHSGAEELLLQWLDSTIKQLEGKLAQADPTLST
jgi:hypothetical protein